MKLKVCLETEFSMANKTNINRKIESALLIEFLSRKFELPNSYSCAHGFLSDELYLSIINTYGFKRLFKVPFLGGLSYLENNNISESRGHHSLAVGLLAYYYSKINNLNKRDERLWVLSGLLHDIHHLPFSHTIEFALKNENPSFSLHDYDLKIIFENNANEKNENIGDIAKRYDIDIENELFPFMSKDTRPNFYNSSHNLDTLEGITRVFQNKYYSKSTDSLPKKIIEANSYYNTKNDDDEGFYDNFWELKGKAYSLEIYDSKKVFFERILSYYLFYLCKNNDLLDQLHRLTDEDFFDNFPKLQSTISLLWLWVNNNCYNCSRNKEISGRGNHLRRSLKIRKFKTNREIKLIDIHDVDSLRKRYEVVNCLTSISFDPNSLVKLTKIIELPINKILNKISNEWEEDDDQNKPLGLYS